MGEEYPIKMGNRNVWWHLSYAYEMYLKFGDAHSVGQVRVLFHIITGKDFNYHRLRCPCCKRDLVKIPAYIEKRIEELLDKKPYGMGNLTVKRKPTLEKDSGDGGAG